MFNEDLVLKVGQADWEGKKFDYIYTVIIVNGEPLEIKLKPASKVEKDLLIREITKNK
jgi:hypothetical protein